MEAYLKHYRAKITARAPIYIGNGSKIGKKEFIYIRGRNVAAVPDMARFFAFLGERNMEDAYTRYMLSRGNTDLGRWLKWQGIEKADYKRFISYSLDAGEALIDTGTDNNRYSYSHDARAKEILCFIKDAEGYPYVPGSSIKGMFRTALFVYEISHSNELRENYKQRIENAVKSDKANRRNFLKNETNGLEQEAFHTLKREGIKRENAVNSHMSGLIISDSEPLKKDALVLCQKIDYSIDKRENRLPILREALRPGTEVFFDITIDTGTFPYDIGTLLEALDEFQVSLYKNFYSSFGRGCREKGTVWLGGGCGFPARTVISALCLDDNTRITAEIFRKTLSDRIYREHGHDRDVAGYGISPHVCKCTRYRGNLYDMGQGRIELL